MDLNEKIKKGDFMRILIALLFCLVTSISYAQDEELKQLEILQSICQSSGNKDTDTNLNELSNLSVSDALPMSIALNLNQNFDLKARGVQIFETYAVRIDFFDGYRFHVADYYDGTCVVTCLDGPLVGYQVIQVHGVITADSSNVVWRKNHFVHRYPNGKIYTYERMQLIELN